MKATFIHKISVLSCDLLYSKYNEKHDKKIKGVSFMSHELTLQEIDQFRSDFDNSRNQVVSRAAMRSGVLEASFNPCLLYTSPSPRD